VKKRNVTLFLFKIYDVFFKITIEFLLLRQKLHEITNEPRDVFCV